MKLFVQARKDGYNILYPKTTPAEFYQFASDLRPIAKMGVSFLGKKIYSIAFSSGGCIFTKHIIVQDVQRESLGNVGFSIYVPNEKKLLGIEVKSLVDELIETYRQNYCADYYLNNKQVDWILFQSLADDYDKKLTPVSAEDVDNFESENNEEAYVYYDNDSELCRYFDDPFQEMYIPYKQIFFVDRNLEKMADNPLNALKYDTNANLTGKIDLENPFYKLREFHGSGKNGITITIKNAKGREFHNRDKVFRKEELTIVYSKKHYHEKRIVGSLLNNEEVRKYLIVNENDKKIDVVKNLDLEPNPKTITFDVVKKKNNVKVTGAVIICKNNNYLPNKIAVNSKITFSPEELEQKWIISANKISENLYSDEIELISERKDETIVLFLEERNIVTLTVKDEITKSDIYDFEVWTKLTNGFKKTNQLEFIDDQILDSYTITIRKNDYEDKNYENFQPYKHKEINIILKKRTLSTDNQTRSYTVNAGENGKLKNNHSYNSIKENGSDVMDVIVPNKGYIFTHFNRENDTLTAQYKNEESIFRKPKVIAVLAFGVIILSLGIWSIVSFLNPNKNEEQIYKREILDYVQGDSLILNQLNYYKEIWEKQKPEVKENGVGILGVFGYGDKQTDYAEYKGWYRAMQSLDSAITKRNLVDSKNFVKLEKLKYTIKQQKFKLAIENLKSKSKYGEVKKQLVDISYLTLTQIADSINSILNKTTKEKLKKPDKMPEDKNSTKPNQETSQASIPKSEKSEITPPKSTASTKGTDPIIKELKSSSITIEQLNGYKGKFPQNKSIKIYLEFWSIIKSNQKKDFDELLNKVCNDNTLKSSELKTYLYKICKSDDAFNKFSIKSGKASCKTLDELKER